MRQLHIDKTAETDFGGFGIICLVGTANLSLVLRGMTRACARTENSVMLRCFAGFTA